MQSLQITGNIVMEKQNDETTPDNIPIVKLWLVLDTQTNGGTATGLDSENVYTNPAAAALMGCSVLRNMLYTKRYKILKQLTVQLPQPSLGTANTSAMDQEGQHCQFDINVDLKGLKTEFLGNAGTVADIVDNGLFLIGCTSSNNTSPSVNYNARLRYRG